MLTEHNTTQPHSTKPTPNAHARTMSRRTEQEENRTRNTHKSEFHATCCRIAPRCALSNPARGSIRRRIHPSPSGHRRDPSPLGPPGPTVHVVRRPSLSTQVAPPVRPSVGVPPSVRPSALCKVTPSVAVPWLPGARPAFTPVVVRHSLPHSGHLAGTSHRRRSHLW